LPGATATLLSHRFPVMLGLTVLHAALSAVLGLQLGVWLDCSLAAAMVVAATGLFVLAWVFAPEQCLVSRCFGVPRPK
ncbi:MAG: manganese/iron transport system permease protein, partial [Limisphaerales bacterium]